MKSQTRREHSAVGGGRAGLAALAVSAWILATWTALTSPSAAAAGEPCPGDVTGDGNIDIEDMWQVLVAWGATSGDADVNEDGVVDVEDLQAVLCAWGPCL